MPEYTMVGLKIACRLTKGREPLPICRDCFDSDMNLVFSAKATHFKTKGQEDKLNKEKNTGSSREKEMPKLAAQAMKYICHYNIMGCSKQCSTKLYVPHLPSTEGSEGGVVAAMHQINFEWPNRL
eukprot:scaffold16473_cov71-Attheya_sp.AAC.3